MEGNTKKIQVDLIWILQRTVSQHYQWYQHLDSDYAEPITTGEDLDTTRPYQQTAIYAEQVRFTAASKCYYINLNAVECDPWSRFEIEKKDFRYVSNLMLFLLGIKGLYRPFVKPVHKTSQRSHPFSVKSS